VCSPDTPDPVLGAPPQGPALKSITLSPSTGSYMVGTSFHFVATGHFADKSQKEVSSTVQWTSSDANVIKVENNGLTLMKGPGKATVTAKDPTTGVSGSITITVKPAALLTIKLSPENQTYVGGADTVVSGATHFSATGVYSDNSTKDITGEVVWSSSAPNVLAIDNKGVGTVKGLGTSSIIAKHASGVSASTKLTIESPGAGAKQIKVQIITKVSSLDGYEGIAEFKSPGAKVVTVGGTVRGNVLDFGLLFLMPEGSVRFMLVSKGRPEGVLSQTTSYKTPEKGLMTFNADRAPVTVTTSAETYDEAKEAFEKKLGAKITGEADFKIAKVGGEVSGEVGKTDENTHGEKHVIQWQLTYPGGPLQVTQGT
jgi:hypothetical protein